MGLREGKGRIWEGKVEPGVPFPPLLGSQLKLEEIKHDGKGLLAGTET